MQIMTQLAFRGQCRQAFERYEEVLGGKITVMNTFGDQFLRDQIAAARIPLA